MAFFDEKPVLVLRFGLVTSLAGNGADLARRAKGTRRGALKRGDHLTVAELARVSVVLTPGIAVVSEKGVRASWGCVMLSWLGEPDLAAKLLMLSWLGEPRTTAVVSK